MKLIKLLCLFGVILLLLHYLPKNPISLNNSKESISRNSSMHGVMPHDYFIKMSFNEHQHKHMHRVNDGGLVIFVDIQESFSDLSINNLIQSVGNFHCNIHCAAIGLNGSIEITRTTTVYNDSDFTELHDEIRDKIKNAIVNEINNL